MLSRACIPPHNRQPSIRSYFVFSCSARSSNTSKYSESDLVSLSVTDHVLFFNVVVQIRGELSCNNHASRHVQKIAFSNIGAALTIQSLFYRVIHQHKNLLWKHVEQCFPYFFHIFFLSYTSNTKYYSIPADSRDLLGYFSDFFHTSKNPHMHHFLRTTFLFSKRCTPVFLSCHWISLNSLRLRCCLLLGQTPIRVTDMNGKLRIKRSIQNWYVPKNPDISQRESQIVEIHGVYYWSIHIYNPWPIR